MHIVIGKTLFALTLSALCATPALAQTADIPSLFSLSQGNAADRAAYRDFIAAGIRDVPCINVNSKDLAQAQAQAQDDMKKFGSKDYATCPNGHIDLVGVSPPVSAAETARNAAIAAALHTAQTAAVNALTAAQNAANVAAFNDTIAAGSSLGCQEMAKGLGVLYLPAGHDATGKVIYAPDRLPLQNWAWTATDAKACVAAVHAETSDAAPMRLPALVLAQTCAFLKATFATPQDDIAASYSSWACGWPAPIPQFRTVPRE